MRESVLRRDEAEVHDVRRHTDGAIDVGFYSRRARRLRSAAIRGALRALARRLPLMLHDLALRSRRETDPTIS